jgi:hypothetical protein
MDLLTMPGMEVVLTAHLKASLLLVMHEYGKTPQCWYSSTEVYNTYYVSVNTLVYNR